jgi:hypothetical protein
MATDWEKVNFIDLFLFQAKSIRNAIWFIKTQMSLTCQKQEK